MAALISANLRATAQVFVNLTVLKCCSYRKFAARTIRENWAVQLGTLPRARLLHSLQCRHVNIERSAQNEADLRFDGSLTWQRGLKLRREPALRHGRIVPASKTQDATVMTPK